MAHDQHIKAQAMAMLLTGDSPRYVAEQLGLPRTTVRRWQEAAFAQVRETFTPDERAQIDDMLAGVRALFPGLLQ